MGRIATLVILVAAVPQPTELPAPWREAPVFVDLFAPADDRAGAYRAYVAAADLHEVLRLLISDRTLSGTPGAWMPEPALPLDVFGRTGRYDRWRVLRLYGGRRPLVARGTRVTGDGTIEAWTLVSPYPDPGLRRLERGTLLLVFRRAG